jgi:hypothetical protein
MELWSSRAVAADLSPVIRNPGGDIPIQAGLTIRQPEH